MLMKLGPVQTLTSSLAVEVNVPLPAVAGCVLPPLFTSTGWIPTSCTTRLPPSLPTPNQLPNPSSSSSSACCGSRWHCRQNSLSIWGQTSSTWGATAAGGTCRARRHDGDCVGCCGRCNGRVTAGRRTVQCHVWVSALRCALLSW